MEAALLASEDRAILDLECETIAGHTCKVIRLGSGAPDIDAVRRRVDERINAVPELATKLGGSVSAPAWVSTGLEVDQQVRPLDAARPLTEADVPDQVARLFERRLDRAWPLWQIHVAPMDGDRTLLIWRVHHALADGTACIRFARELLLDAAADSPDAATTVATRTSGRSGDDVRRRLHLASFIDREYGRSLHRSPFDGEVGTRRRIAFASAPITPLHDAAKQLSGATLNDALLSVVAGALRRWLTHHHGALGALRVRVPVSLHHEGDVAANRDSFFSLRLPLNEADPLRRLRAIQHATTERKADHDAEEREELLRELSAVSRRMESFCERLEASPRSFALSVSNVPGPRRPVSVLDAPVESIHSIAEIGSRHALRVSVVSLADRLNFGFCADPAIVDDLEEMAAGVEAEAVELVAAAAR